MMAPNPASDSSEVLVYGEALVDIVIDGDSTTEAPGGSPANVALGLGRLGIDVALLTSLGRDRFGRQIEEHLAASGVRVLPESYTEAPTSSATAHITSDRRTHYLFDVTWNPAPARPSAEVRHLHTGSVAAFQSPGADLVLRAMSEAKGGGVSFDPNIRPEVTGDHRRAVDRFEQAIRLASLVKLSDEDAAWLYPDLSVDSMLDRLLQSGVDLAAVTIGASGAVLASSTDRVLVPGAAVTVVDTIGAGDTFMASLIASTLRLGTAPLGADALWQVGREAAAAAGITVSRRGADLPHRRDLSTEEVRVAPGDAV